MSLTLPGIEILYSCIGGSTGELRIFSTRPGTRDLGVDCLSSQGRRKSCSCTSSRPTGKSSTWDSWGHICNWGNHFAGFYENAKRHQLLADENLLANVSFCYACPWVIPIPLGLDRPTAGHTEEVS